MPRKERIVGILGVMGPEATVDLMRRIIKNTPAQDDRDHVRCIVDNNPQVPSRIKALVEGGGESPAPVIAEMARRLELWGADFLCIACNTAHAYYRDIQAAVRIPVLNMISLAVERAVQEAPGSSVGILASPAVRSTRLYSDLLEARGVETVYPDPGAEAALFALIKEIKKGDTGRKSREALASVIRNLEDKKAGIAIGACTELGIVMEEEAYGIRVLDAADALAQAVVREAKNKE